MIKKKYDVSLRETNEVSDEAISRLRGIATSSVI